MPIQTENMRYFASFNSAYFFNPNKKQLPLTDIKQQFYSLNNISNILIVIRDFIMISEEDAQFLAEMLEKGTVIAFLGKISAIDKAAEYLYSNIKIFDKKNYHYELSNVLFELDNNELSAEVCQKMNKLYEITEKHKLTKSQLKRLDKLAEHCRYL